MRVLAVMLAACSASGGARKAGNQQPSAGTGADSGSAGASGGNGFGNSDGRVGPTLPVLDGGTPKPPTGKHIEPITIDECGANNPAGLSPADVKTLKAASGAGSLRYLYPYDGTVFPRGLLAPTWMWDGAGTAATDAVYLHIKSQAFEYFGCLKPTAAGQLQLDQALWNQASERTYGTSDPYTVELRVLSAGTATGPAVQKIVIAQASIKGSIYYNSYTSKLAGGAGQGQSPGIVLRIPPAGKVETFITSECNGCHSVSADGSRMIDQTDTGTGGGRSYKLLAGGGPNPMPTTLPVRGSYGGLYPDGSRYVTTSGAKEIAYSNMYSGNTPNDSTLINSDDGSVIPSVGIPPGALMPTFAMDGKALVFADFAIAQGLGLAVMKFDGATNTASAYRMLYQDSKLTPAWPFFLPDSKGIVFLRTDSSNLTGQGGVGGLGGLGGLLSGILATGSPFGELTLADVASGSTVVLAQAMGYRTVADADSGTTYLPFGAEDLHHNYFPTVSPVAAGGYFWVFFDAIRHYGNMGLVRQLWGSAVDIAPDGTYTVDRSHPAFYLPGQEFGTGNHRAFAALDPCKKDGVDCTSGIDCCGGFCFIPTNTSSEFGQPVGKCTSTVSKCSKHDERCTSSADCCPPTGKQVADSCIGGYCAVLQVLR
ncbi:MAG TPA: hypothetical protein VF331_24385 [Polyangiales bacterium]